MYGKRKKEHGKHEMLLKSLKKHFRKDEEEMDDEGNEDAIQVKPMNLYQNKKDRRISINEDYDDDLEPHSDVYASEGHATDANRMYGENAESNDEGYDSISSDDDEEYEKDQEEEYSEDTGPQLTKSQRKRLAVAAISKKMSKPKKR